MKDKNIKLPVIFEEYLRSEGVLEEFLLHMFPDNPDDFNNVSMSSWPCLTQWGYGKTREDSTRNVKRWLEISVRWNQFLKENK